MGDRNRAIKIACFWLTFLLCSSTWARLDHDLVRRIVVFPFQAAAGFSKEAEEGWWKVREVLTEDKRFLVASKNFLERKDVFQARGSLSPADVIILGELLDAHLILTGQIKNRKLILSAYESKRGQIFWQESMSMHPSSTLGEQVQGVAQKLTKTFIAAFPYQGFVVKDPLIGRTVYEENDKHLVQVFVGTHSSVKAGDPLQWVNVFSENLKPLLQGGASLEVFAEGKVVSVNSEGIATAEVQRVTNLKNIQENSLVRFPKELRRLKELYALKDSIQRRVSPEYFSPEISDLRAEEHETKPLVTALSWLVNMATILLLAF